MFESSTLSRKDGMTCLCCPNNPDDAKMLSDVAGAKIDEMFIGSCMTDIGHFRAASKLLKAKCDISVKLWIAPPIKMEPPS